MIIVDKHGNKPYFSFVCSNCECEFRATHTECYMAEGVTYCYCPDCGHAMPEVDAIPKNERDDPVECEDCEYAERCSMCVNVGGQNGISRHTLFGCSYGKRKEDPHGKKNEAL